MSESLLLLTLLFINFCRHANITSVSKGDVMAFNGVTPETTTAPRA